jgi:hypothetical protein
LKTTGPDNQDWQGALEAALAELETKWLQLRTPYESICATAYRVWKVTPKNGSAGKVGKTLKNMGIRKNTFYSWVRHHRIEIGEIEDADITEDPGPVVEDVGGREGVDGDEPDDDEHDVDDGDESEDEYDSDESQDEAKDEDGGNNDDDAAKGGSRTPKSRGGQPSVAKTYAVTLEGKKLLRFSAALQMLRQFYPWGSDSAAIYNSVIKEAERLALPPSNPAVQSEEEGGVEAEAA